MSPGQQGWFEVSGPASSRLPRPKMPKRPTAAAETAPQLELRMPQAKAPPSIPAVDWRRPVASVPAPPPQAPRRAFGSWLLDQTKRPGSLGELANAAKLDRLFPRNGSAEDVRRRFGAAGADGDAFEALDDAEREYDRQTS